MMESILKTINSLNSANYQFNKFLSVSAWTSLSTLIISTESIPDDLTRSIQVKQHPQNYLHIFVSEFVIP